MFNLADVNVSEQLKFVKSFDHVLCDLDGVIWLQHSAIPGAPDCINTLKNFGKEIHYVSNNSTAPVDYVKGKLDACNIITDERDIVIPTLAVISYLKKINFTKSLYVIGPTSLKTALEKEGFSLAAEGVQTIEEPISSIVEHIQDDVNVGGVLVDFDMNLSYIKLQKAVTYLQRDDCMLLAGGSFPKVPIGGHMLIGVHYYLKPLIDFSRKEVCQLAKPDPKYNEYIIERFKITDINRVLFIGDTVSEDMNFATKCGYQKLLVLTGATKMEHLRNWTFPEEYKPRYYVESMSVFNDILENIYRRL